jgi:hypothetical protein
MPGFNLFNVQAPLHPNLMGRWLFNDSAVDASGRGHDATLVGTTSYVAGNNGNALRCTSGLTGYVTVADHADLTPNNITICCWVKLRSDNGVANEIINRMTDIAGNFAFDLYIAPTSLVLQFGVLAPSLAFAGGDAITTGSWYHIAGTFDGTSVKCFVNGTVGGTIGSVTGNITYTNSYPMTFASAIGSANYRSTDADIDDAQIYNIALPQSEIQRVMNGYMPLT